MCSHVTASIWRLGVERAVDTTSVHPRAAVKLLDAVNDSMKFFDDDINLDTDNQLFLAFATTTNKNVGNKESSDQ